MALEIDMLEEDNPLADVESTTVDDADEAGRVALRKAALSDLNIVNAGIAALVAEFGGKTYEVATTAGMDAAKAARMAIRTPRFRVEHIRKAKKAELRAIGTEIETEAARITEALMEIEDPIDAQIKVETDKKAAEKAAKEQAAREKQAEIDGAIADITNKVVEVAGQPADVIAEALAWLDATEVTLEDFGDSAGRAMQAKAGTQAKLEEMLQAARAHEAELQTHAAERAAMQQEREAMAAERAEMDRMKAENKARQDALEQQERDRVAEEARQAQAVRDRAHAVQVRIDAIQMMARYHEQSSSTSETIQGAMDGLGKLTITEAFFESRVAEAESAVAAARTDLATLHAAAVQAEAEAAEKAAAAQRKKDEAAARIRVDAMVRDLAPQMLAGLEMVSLDAKFAALAQPTRECVAAVLAAAKVAA